MEFTKLDKNYLELIYYKPHSRTWKCKLPQFRTLSLSKYKVYGGISAESKVFVFL